jgi:aspartyl-tRNA(Asn)/glutamyl-tRNA(Gln) amidotransferase subunit B
MERELFVRVAMCIDPRKPEAAGLWSRAKEALGIGVTGLDPEEEQHRRGLKKRIYRELGEYTEDIETFPGLGPHVGFPSEKQIVIPIPEKLLKEVAKKIVRGCEFVLADKRIIEPPHAIDIYFADDAKIRDVLRLFARFGPVYLGPGFEVRRAVAHDDPHSVMYRIEIWGTWVIYASILDGMVAPKLEPPVAARAKYEPVIGLEVHVQLLTVSKIFCSCSARFGAPPNTNVCPVCLGLPGALPVLNRKAVDFAVLAAMALGCRINETSIFARKNYFYPDLPKGYQISQYDKPLAEFGRIDITTANGSKKIGITRLHLEEDAGKSLHEGFADSAETTAIDLNRSGVPLIEIVSEPDIASPAEAHEYLTRLKEIILYTGVSDCNMEEGSLRCDANVSVRPRGQKQFGTKTEIKNVNSFRFIREALEFEIDRQVGILESGGKITQETRLYNSGEGKTYGMRSKEQAHDYRYFPEPDLLPLVVDEKWQAEIRSTLPELPESRRKRMVADYGITDYDAQVLTATKSFADQFEAAAKAAKNPKRVANLVQGELMGRLKAKGLEIEQSPISMTGVALSANLVESGAISGKMLKDLYDLSFERGQDFGEVYEKEKPQQITDSSAIEKIIDEIVAANPKQVEQYRAGKKTVIGFFVGQVMKSSQGQANPQMVNELLTRKLEG